MGQSLLDRALIFALRSTKGLDGARLSTELALIKEKLTYLWLRPLQLFAVRKKLREVPSVRPFSHQPTNQNGVDKFWSRHTIGGFHKISTEMESSDYIEFFRTYAPLKHQLCDLYGEHEGEVILDYGCGPGNDLVGFALRSKAMRLIGADVSRRALEMARCRVALHQTDWSRLEFLQLSDSTPKIPIPDGTVDYVHCLGVIHHVSHPLETLREFHRVMRPGATARMMAYNAESVYVNLNVAYELQVLSSEYPRISAEKAFEEKADLGAPIALCRKPEYWVELARQAGFQARFIGAYFSRAEPEAWERSAKQALSDHRLPEIHRGFLKALTLGPHGYPELNGLPAGMSAVFLLEKA